jgi:hypothetical protein
MDQRSSHSEDPDHTVPSGDARDEMTVVAATTGRVLLWAVVVIAAMVVLALVLFIGPIGLITVVPAILVIWLAASSMSGGPAAGA